MSGLGQRDYAGGVVLGGVTGETITLAEIEAALAPMMQFKFAQDPARAADAGVAREIYLGYGVELE